MIWESDNTLIVERIEIPKNCMHLLVNRRPQESLEEWAKRCAVIYNIAPLEDNGSTQDKQ